MPSKTQLPLFPDFAQLLSNLNDEHADYLLIGGYAVMVHAQPRATKDLDIFIRCDTSNAQAVWNALVKFGAAMEGITPEYFAELGNGFRIGRPPIMVEVLTQIDGIDFAGARSRAQLAIVNDEGLQVPIISADDLITNKLAAGRPSDLADVDAVRQAAIAREQAIIDQHPELIRDDDEPELDDDLERDPPGRRR